MTVFFFTLLSAKINWSYHSITYILNITLMKIILPKSYLYMIVPSKLSVLKFPLYFELASNWGSKHIKPKFWCKHKKPNYPSHGTIVGEIQSQSSSPLNKKQNKIVSIVWLGFFRHNNSLSIVAQKWQFYCDKMNTKLLFCLLLVFPTLCFLTPCAHHWLAWSATQVQQMFLLYFRDVAIFSCLQVCSLKPCRELHRALFYSWVSRCPHREADGWWFPLLSGFSISWEDFWANSPEQQQPRAELLGTKQTWKRTRCLCHPMECWSLTCHCCVLSPYGTRPEESSPMVQVGLSLLSAGVMCVCTKHHCTTKEKCCFISGLGEIFGSFLLVC